MRSEQVQLRGGAVTSDPRLDRLPQFDEKSRSFPITAVVTEQAPVRSMTWYCPAWLDQGQEGACVGFSWAHELNALPAKAVVDDKFAREAIYRAAQKIDEWAGEAYEGTSVLAGAKIVQRLGFIDQYRWAFGVDDLVRAVGYTGPAVIGVPWLSSMFRPRPSGLLEVSRKTSDIAGGHAIMIRGITLRPKIKGEPINEPVFRLRNSWGRDWGADGDCFVKVSDMEWLLDQDGEACIPLGRHRQPVTDRTAIKEIEDVD